MHSNSISRARILSSPFSTPIQKNKFFIGKPVWKRKPCTCLVAMAPNNTPPRPRILVVGGGIGGLVFAMAARNKGFEVVVLEKGSSVVRGEGEHRGPILLESNALSALEAIDSKVAAKIIDAGNITGNRVNGIVDGLSGHWFAKYDTFTPAVGRGQPVGRNMCRIALQQILMNAVGDDVVYNNSNVVNFVDNGNKVTVMLENGQQLEGDLLVGADGIRSKVREILLGPYEASYSGYTCYTGISDYVPPDIEAVGVRAFLGKKKYFASCEVCSGKMQWYAFHEEPEGGTDSKNGKKERLLHIFGDWCHYVVDAITATSEETILRRDIFDHIPSITWGKGRVTLLGDSIHAIQPNLGQGGCMAIEDAYQLASNLEKAWIQSLTSGIPVDIVSALKRYEEQRRIRTAVMHGLGRMNSIMTSIYEPCSIDTGTFLSSIHRFAWVGSRFFLKVAVPLMLNWIIAGNSATLEGRIPSCQLSDKASEQFKSWFEDDDDALERTTNRDTDGRMPRILPKYPFRLHHSDLDKFGSEKEEMFGVNGNALKARSKISPIRDV